MTGAHAEVITVPYLHFSDAVLRGRWGGQQFFRVAYIARQLLAEVPDIKHFVVLERGPRVELNPLLNRQALGVGTGVILQTQTPMRSLSENFFVYFARGSGFN
jgi:hypothetical protein